MSDADPTRLGYNYCVLRNIIRAGWALWALLVLFTPRGTALARHFHEPQALSLKLGNQVFNDLNNNGLRDADEPGVPHVLVRLLDANLTVVSDTRTDANGLYEFSALGPGNYSIEIVLPPSYQSSQDVASSAAPDNGVDDDDNGVLLLGSVVRSNAVWVGADDLPAENLSLDFGTWQPATLGDWVWQDGNNNGLQDENELGLPDVAITLYDANHAPITTTRTDASGHYFFDGLRPGRYALGATLSEGYEFAPQSQGNNDDFDSAADSDIDPLTGRTALTTLQPGENNSHLDVGLFPTALQLSIALTAQPRPSQPGDPASVRPGDLVTYTIAITNIGGHTVTHVAVFNVVPAGAVYLAGSASPSLDDSSTATNLVWTAPALSASQSMSLSFVVKVDASSSSILTKLRNQAIVRSDQTPPNTSNRTSHDVVPQTTPGPALAVLVLPEMQTITVGSTAVFTVQVTNTGGFDLYGTQVHPSTLVDCDHFIGDLAVGESVSYTCQQPNVMAAFTDTLTVSGFAGRASLVLSSFTTSVALKPVARLGDYVWMNESGDGMQRADVGMSGVVVQLLRLSLTSTSVPLSATTPVIVLSQTTNTRGFYMFDDVPPGQYQVCVLPPAGYSFARQGSTTNSGADSDADPATGCTRPITASAGLLDASIDVGLVPVVMQLAQTSQPRPTDEDNRLHVNIGDRITYTLNLRNSGLQPARNVSVTDELPIDVQLITGTAQPTATEEAGRLGWSLAVLAPGERYTMSFAVRVVSKLHTSVQNHAFVQTNQTPPTNSNEVVHVFSPTAVKLMAFVGRWVQANKTGIELTWQTGAEINSFGFALYRSETGARADRVRVTPEWIAAQSSGGASYAFVDETALLGKQYTYWLVEVERDGDVVEYDSITMNSTNAIVAVNVNAGGVPMAVAIEQPVAAPPAALSVVLSVVINDAPTQSVAQVIVQPVAEKRAAGDQSAPSALIAAEPRAEPQPLSSTPQPHHASANTAPTQIPRAQPTQQAVAHPVNTTSPKPVQVMGQPREVVAIASLQARSTTSSTQLPMVVWALAGLIMMLSLVGGFLLLNVFLRADLSGSADRTRLNQNVPALPDRSWLHHER